MRGEPDAADPVHRVARAQGKGRSGTNAAPDSARIGARTAGGTAGGTVLVTPLVTCPSEGRSARAHRRSQASPSRTPSSERPLPDSRIRACYFRVHTLAITHGSPPWSRHRNGP